MSRDADLSFRLRVGGFWGFICAAGSYHFPQLVAWFAGISLIVMFVGLAIQSEPEPKW